MFFNTVKLFYRLFANSIPNLIPIITPKCIPIIEYLPYYSIINGDPVVPRLS